MVYDRVESRSEGQAHHEFSASADIARQTYDPSTREQRHWNPSDTRSGSSFLPPFSVDGDANHWHGGSGESSNSADGIKQLLADFQQFERLLQQIAAEIQMGAAGGENPPQSNDAPTGPAQPAMSTDGQPGAITSPPVEPVTGGQPSSPPEGQTGNSSPTQEAPPVSGSSAGGGTSGAAGDGGSDSTTAPGTSASTTSGLSVENGQLMENGKVFTPGGVAANPTDVVNNPNFIQTLIGSGADQFDSNFIRLAMPADGSNTTSSAVANETVQAAQQIEAAAQAAGKTVVVEIEQHITTGATLTGAALSQSEQLYGQMAQQTKGDGNIIYGTPNEPSPQAGTSEPDYVNEQTGIINAIRGAGNNTAVMVETGEWGTATENNWLQQNASTFEQAAGGNAIGDVHVYINNSSEVAPIENVIGQLKESGMPTIIGEYGNAPSGTPTVPDSPALVYQIQNDTGVGNVGWELFPVGSPENSETSTQGFGDVFYNGQNSDQLNQYGVEILQHLNPAGVTAADEQAPAVGA